MNLLNTKRKKISKYFFFFVCVLFVFSVQNVYASPSSFIYGITTGTGGMFAGLGGMFLDSAITNLVLQMGHLFINKGLGAVVTSVWTMIRDLFNILFIFSLVYIGLRTIYDADDSRTKKLLGSLIAAALLINFSLYIAKVVVDISNFTAVEIYKMAAGGISGTYGIKDVITLNTGSLAGAYMEVLNISSWFTTDEGVILDSGNAIIFGIFAMLFLMFMGFVLAYGALMLLVRFIAIVFYLMFSPLMFLGWILPQFKSYSTKWWKGFLGYSFFAPAYIFMLYVGLYALAQIKTEFGTDATFGGFFTSDEKTVNTFSIFLMFIIGTGFLYGATKVASTMSQGGAAIGMNMADKWSRKIVGTASGAIYRQTGGRAAGRVLSTMDWTDRQMAKGEVTVGRMHKLNPIKYVAKAGLGATREVVGGTTTRGVVESARNYGAGGRGRKQVEDDMKAQNERTHKANKKAQLKKILTSGTPTEKMAALKQLSVSEIDEMAKDHKGRQTLLANAHFLTDNHLKKFESEHPELHNKIKNKIKNKILQDFNTNPPSAFVDAAGNRRPAKEIAKFDTSILTDPRAVPNLDARVLHHIYADTTMSDTDRATIKQNILHPDIAVTPQITNMRHYLNNTNEGQLF